MRPFAPTNGWAGDVTPFYSNGVFHLFYLKDTRDLPVDDPAALAHAPDSRTSFHHLVTTDFESYEDLGPILEPSDPSAQDSSMGTGCVVHHAGMYWLFYSGINEQLEVHPQAVMLATSRDLTSWTRDARFRLVPDGRYEPRDWRDPFVFWNETEGAWWMLVAARVPTGPRHRRGCTALATSPDLLNWTIEDPIFAPGLYYTHECPDLFSIGDRWYLVFSTFSQRMQTHYRTAPSPRGPFTRPSIDTLDGRAFYAAKSVSGECRRVMVGWDPTRVGDNDDGEWQWGGTLVAHDVAATPDGRLVPIVASPLADPDGAGAASRGRAGPALPIAASARVGAWTVSTSHRGAVAETSDAGFAFLDLGEAGGALEITGVIEPGPSTTTVGFILHADSAFEHYYELRLEIDVGRLTLERCPRRGDAPPLVQQPSRIDSSGPTRFSLLVEGTLVVLVVDGVGALTGRAYAPSGSRFGIFAENGGVRVSDLRITAA